MGGVMNVHVLCDFDGTIVAYDVYDVLMEKFGGQSASDLFDRFRSGELNSQQVIEAGWESFTVPREALEAEMHSMAIDPHFPEFLDWCMERGWSFSVLSDGLDWYINAVLEGSGIVDVPMYANQLRFEGETPIFSYPYFDRTCPLCGHRFAVCKRNVVRERREKGEFVIFIGDGSSDRCGAREADMVIARRKLRLYCEDEGIPYLSFETFEDILGLKEAIDEAIQTRPTGREKEAAG